MGKLVAREWELSSLELFQEHIPISFLLSLAHIEQRINKEFLRNLLHTNDCIILE